QRGHAGIIEKGRVVGTITQRSQTQVGTIAQLLAVLRAGGASYSSKVGALPHGNVLLRILNLTLDLVDRALQRVRAGDAQVAACAGIGVQIHHSVLAQFILVLLNPLGGTQQARFFAVPRAVDNGPLRTPALFHQLAQRSCLLQYDHHARNWIVSSVDPGIVMIASNHPLLGSVTTWNL